MIGDEKIAEIRERTDIVALIGEYVALKRAGAQFKGLCPFHSEKSPSFHVHPERQFFHCFGCQTSGDGFAFVMKLEGRSFIEAARFLAERAGIEIAAEDTQEEQAHRQQRQERDRLLAITEAAAGFFVRMLDEHPLGRMAVDAIAKRSVTLETARTYRLGYAPHGWDPLARFLAQRGFSMREAELAGLVAPRRSGDGFYDRFRHRLMFPIADVHGRIVAFSGRILDLPPGEPAREGDPPAKYVNSPEGPLYKKGELLFGLHEARVDLRREGEAIVCEGNFDVLAVHQAGRKNVVAPLGTAFTAMQAKLLRRYCSKVTLLFDGDRAGRKAVASAYPLLMSEALVTKVASLPTGDDPDSYLRAHGPDALKERIASGLPIVEHLIESSAADAGVDPAARAAAIETLGPVLMAIPNPVEARLWVERIAQAFEIHDLDAVRRQLRKGIRQPTRKPTQGSSPAAAPRPAPAPPPEYPELEKDVVGAMLDHPGLLGSSEAAMVDALLTSEDLRAILRVAARLVGSRGGVNESTLRASAHSAVGFERAVGPNELASAVSESSVVSASELLGELGDNPARTWLEERLSVQTFDAAGAESFLRTALPHLRKRRIERELRSLAPLIKQALVRGDTERATELMRRRDELYRMGVASPSAPPATTSARPSPRLGGPGQVGGFVPPSEPDEQQLDRGEPAYSEHDDDGFDPNRGGTDY